MEDKLKQAVDERDSIYPMMEKFKMQIAVLESDKEHLQNEKNHLFLSKKIVEEELNQLVDSTENLKQMDPVQYAEEIKGYNDKIEMLTADKGIQQKEIELAKKEIDSEKTKIEKLLSEKQKLTDNYNELEKQLIQNKEVYQTESKYLHLI